MGASVHVRVQGLEIWFEVRGGAQGLGFYLGPPKHALAELTFLLCNKANPGPIHIFLKTWGLGFRV